MSPFRPRYWHITLLVQEHAITNTKTMSLAQISNLQSRMFLSFNYSFWKFIPLRQNVNIRFVIDLTLLHNKSTPYLTLGIDFMILIDILILLKQILNLSRFINTLVFKDIKYGVFIVHRAYQFLMIAYFIFNQTFSD